MSNQTELNRGKTSVRIKPDFSKTPLTYPEPDKRLKSNSLKGYLGFMGPGLILASCGIGTGEVYYSSQIGAIFGTVLIWTFVLSVVTKGFAIWSGSRYITLTGESPVGRWGQIFPGPKNWFPFLMGILSFICFPAWGAGLSTALGQLSSMMFGFGQPLYWATFWIVITIVMNFMSNYDLVEKAMTWTVVFMVVFVIIAVFVSKPDWLGILSGFLPTIPSEYSGWIVDKYPKTAAKSISLTIIACLGALGGGTYDYIGYIGLYRQKGWGMLGNPNVKEIEEKLSMLEDGEMVPLIVSEEEVSKAKTWLKATNIDAIVSFGSVFIFGTAFMILGSVILLPQQLIPNDTDIIKHQISFLTIISPVLKYLYYIGVWGALFGTMYGCSSELYVWTIKESWGPCFKAVREMEFKKLRNIELAFYCGGALFLNWTGISFQSIISFAGIVGGSFATGLWAFAQLYTEKKLLPKEYRMGKFAAVMVAFSGAVLTFLGIVGFLQFFKIV